MKSLRGLAHGLSSLSRNRIENVNLRCPFDEHCHQVAQPPTNQQEKGCVFFVDLHQGKDEKDTRGYQFGVWPACWMLLKF